MNRAARELWLGTLNIAISSFLMAFGVAWLLDTLMPEDIIFGCLSVLVVGLGLVGLLGFLFDLNELQLFRPRDRRDK